MKYAAKHNFTQIGENTYSFKPKCHAIIFKNVGDMRAKINGTWVLEPGEETPSLSSGHPEVIDLTDYKIIFESDSGGTAPAVNVIYTTLSPYSNKDAADNCEPN